MNHNPTLIRPHGRFGALLLGLALMLAGCSTTNHPAPVVEHGSNTRPAASTRAPTTNPVVRNADKAPDGPGLYTVKKGDSLIRIALDHGRNYRDLVAWNNLVNPNDIKVDQVLRVAPPEGAAQTERVISPPTAGSSSTASTGTTASTGSTIKPGTPVAVVNKSSPRGDKRAYSDTTLAELQKPDAGGQKTTAPVVASAGGSTPAPATPATPAPPASTGSDEPVSWIWPTEGKILAGFDEGKNKGIDIGGQAGQQILAAGAGKVMYAGSVRGYGNLVIVRHSNSLLSAYAHNQNILVKEGQSVKKGQLIAEMGNSDSDATKLHFEIRQQGKPVDPARYLPSRQL